MKKYIILFTILSLLISCEKYLEFEPVQQLKIETVFETIEDFDIAMRGAYYQMHEDVGYYDGVMTIMPDVLTDNLIICSEGRRTFSQTNYWNYNEGNYYVGRIWRQVYKPIKAVNEVISRLKTWTWENENDSIYARHLLGEAYAIRAMAHFDLVRFFGVNYSEASSTDLGVPYMLTPEISKPSRGTVDSNYIKIVTDLTNAVSLMANDIDNVDLEDDVEDENEEDEGRDEDLIRINKAAAFGLLSRVYLTMGEWQNTINAADSALALAPVSAETDALGISTLASFPDVWTDASDAGVLFKIKMTSKDASGTTSGSSIGTYYSQTSAQEGTKSEYVCSYELYQLYQPTDVRLGAYISTSDYKGKTFNHIWKYKERTGSNAPDLVDAKVIRVAEVVLNRAEAYMNLSSPNEAAALADLNALRAQRYAGFVPGAETGATLRTAIALERRLELAFEGHRWFDLKRTDQDVSRQDYGDEADGSGLKYLDLNLDKDDIHWELPIPTSEQDANENMLPNPGY